MNAARKANTRIKLIVTRATLRQLDELVPLFLGYLEFYRVPRNAVDVRRFLRARLKRGESVIFLARHAGEPVGLMQLYPTFASLALGRAWILSDLYVVPGARRQGVATALLKRAHRLDGAELMLETARTNRRAQRLYEALGWQRDEEFLVYRRRK